MYPKKNYFHSNELFCCQILSNKFKWHFSKQHKTDHNENQ